MPIAHQLADPAPVLKASGNTPNMKASEVIQDQAQGITAPSSVASIRVRPCSRSALANSTMSGNVRRRSGKGETAGVKAHRRAGNRAGMVNPSRSKTK